MCSVRHLESCRTGLWVYRVERARLETAGCDRKLDGRNGLSLHFCLRREACVGANAPASTVPREQFHWRESLDSGAIRGAGRLLFCISAEPDSDPGLLANANWGSGAADDSSHVLSVAVVGWTRQAIRGAKSFNDWSSDCRGRVSNVRCSSDGRQLLDDILPSVCRARPGNRSYSGAADNGGHEFGRAESCRNCIGSE